MAINKIQISKIFALPTEPSKATLNRFWYDTTNKILKHYDGTSWVPLQVHADDVVVLPNGDTKSLTECLSIIGDGLDSLETSKQNKLLYYSETSGDSPSATISVANIKLDGKVAEGSGTASGTYSHAEGVTTKASGGGSHAEGRNTTASGTYSHAEGSGTEALKDSSHAEGNQTTASGNYSHAEGSVTTASGQNSHTEGLRTTASGQNSHAEGYRTTASSENQHVQGKWNIEDANSKYLDIIGNGTGASARSNAATVSWDGISWSQSDVRAGGTDQDSATHSLAAKQNATDNSLETTDKTIVGAINELSTDKQNTLKYYSESDSSTEPSSNNAQVSILKTSDYQGTLNLGFETSNGIQTINIGGSSNTRNINIGTKICGENNNVTIGNASDGVLLTLNTGRGLAGTGVTKDLSTSATDAQFPTAAAVNSQLILKQNITDNTLTTTAKTIVGAINEIENKVLDSRLSKLSAGALYFNSGKLSGSNFAVPTFPFSICATVRIDAWKSASDHSQTIFQYGELGSGTGSTCSIGFIDGENKPKLRLVITDTVDGANKSSEVNCSLDLSTFLGKMHTIIGIYRAVTDEALNWDIYIDGVKQNITSSAKNAIVSSLSGTRTWAVNTTNYNFSSQPASANPMMLRNLYVFNFDVSAEDSPYSIADYAAGKLIPPSLIGNQFTGMYGSGWSVSGDTATCSGSSNTTFLNISRGVVPSGFDFSFTLDIDLSFSGTALFEVYTNCQKAHAEIYDYSTELTTQKDSANGGGFYGNSSLGITSSGHYRIKFDCESSLGGRGARQIACGALSSGTIILSNTYYTRCNLALENYTIARNATTKLVKDASGNSNDATVQGSGTVAGDNDQSIKAFVDEIKTQINQSNG